MWFDHLMGEVELNVAGNALLTPGRQVLERAASFLKPRIGFCLHD